MNKNLLIAILAVYSGCNAFAADKSTFAQVAAGGQTLFSEAKLDINALSLCQPLEGDTVAILEVSSNFQGNVGLNIAHVRVISGLCKDQMGWIGISRLKSLQEAVR